MNEVLQIKISNTEPVDLIDFTKSCLAFADEYKRFSVASGVEGKSSLKIKEIRPGSIEMDLVPIVTAIGAYVAAEPVAAMLTVNTVGNFVKHISSLVNWLGKGGRAPDVLPDSKTLDNIAAIVEPIAKDSGSNITINYAPVNVSISGDVNAPVFLNSSESNVLQNVAARQKKELKEPEKGEVLCDMVLNWHQSQNSYTGKGDCAIIERITKKPLRTVFSDKSMKALLLDGNENIFSKTYIVDVVVEYVEDVPKLYRIQKIEPIDNEE